ncbi:MAG: coproporphyrinogen III oxidase [Pseudomonadota bacterium]|nr:coproporphyrinogen III oxidase [Pseudomonadota bacterium]MDE3036841.1 coproporphyrinogen III oxidase [Pseudomonadota bacterium]
MPATNHSTCQTPQQARGLLAVYIHWPFCKSKCPYCDFNSHVREEVEQDRWRSALLKELEYMAAHIPNRQVTSIFFGGGTPSLMPPDTSAALIGRVHSLWSVSDDLEITLEANPTSVEADTFADFKAAGINRVSLGVQSLRDEELKFLGRGHSAGEALKAVERARRTFDRYSFDLIYARPGQTTTDWEKELSDALNYADGHLSLYQLTIEENTAFHHAYAKGGFALPDEAEAEALYRLTEDVMATHRLPAYEVSNYARPGEESRHNLAYWQGREYVGIGPGAHGRLDIERSRMERNTGLARSPDRASPLRHATQTLKSPERWLEQVEKEGHGVELWQPLSAREAIEERVMMGLRLREGIGYAAFAEQTGQALDCHIHLQKRDAYITQGMLAGDPARLQTTLKGRLVLNRLTAELLS